MKYNITPAEQIKNEIRTALKSSTSLSESVQEYFELISRKTATEQTLTAFQQDRENLLSAKEELLAHFGEIDGSEDRKKLETINTSLTSINEAITAIQKRVDNSEWTRDIQDGLSAINNQMCLSLEGIRSKYQKIINQQVELIIEQINNYHSAITDPKNVVSPNGQKLTRLHELNRLKISIENFDNLERYSDERITF